ncbi:MAG TPA: preprotein translocase subunit SecE [Gaiellaceae bacterium]
MARQTRSQRRARRLQQADGEKPKQKAVDRARARQAQVRPGLVQPKSQGGQRRAPGGGTLRFVRESWGELKKVEWPRRPQVLQGTAVVLIACTIVGLFLWLNDEVWKRVVQNVLLGQ